MPLHEAGAGVRNRLGNRLLVQIDLVPVLRGKRAGVACGL